jgi:hypothetical protein
MICGPVSNARDVLTCYTNAEVVSVVLADVFDEVGGVLELVARGDPVLFSPWRVCVREELVSMDEGMRDE